jgi:hypothetical protein
VTKNVAEIILPDELPPVGAPFTEFGSPPDSVLKVLLGNTGRRLKKREVQYSHRSWNGMYMGEDGGYSAVDHSGAYTKALTRRERRAEKRAARKEAPAGNLDETDYQFWRGSPAPTAYVSMCRWCDRSFYNKDDRHDHFSKEGNCSHKIRAVQAYAAKQDATYCLCCGALTTKLRWGFPLCNTVQCIGQWKFAPLASQYGWMMYRKLAREDGSLDKWEVGSTE